MANPNILLANNIYGKTALMAPTTTLSNVLVNSAGSGQILKLNSVTYANYEANNVPIWVTFNRGTTPYYLAGSVTVPGYSTLVVVAKDTSIYLEEGDYLKCNVGSQANCSVVVSYELIE